MKTPGPDHPITIERNPRRVRVRFGDHVIADTNSALSLAEAGYPPVLYLPREDVETGFLSQSPYTSRCPYKGDATYYSMMIDGDLAENVAWSYEAPYPAMEQISGLLAFDPKKVEVYEIDEASTDEHRNPEAVERWPAPK